MPRTHGIDGMQKHAKSDRTTIHQIHPNQDGGYKKYYEFETRAQVPNP